MEKPTNTKKTPKPYKQDIYEVYVVWRSIPACFRLKIGKQVVKALKENDALYGELITIKNQTEFAEKYGVENSTLSNWNKLIAKENPLSEIRKWGQELTKNVLFSLYRHALDTGNAQSCALWFQIVEGWSNKKSKYAERTFTPVAIIDHTVIKDDGVKATN